MTPALPQADLASVHSDGGKGTLLRQMCQPGMVLIPPSLHKNNNNNRPTHTVAEGATEPETKLFYWSGLIQTLYSTTDVYW